MLFATGFYNFAPYAATKTAPKAKTEQTAGTSRQIPQRKFEEAVKIIKKYETIHTTAHWPYIGYGHLVQKNEKYARRNYSEKESDEILRKDLRKFCDMFSAYGKDRLLLGVLAYSIGPFRLLGAGKMPKSNLLKKLENGNRNIRADYLAYSKYKGRAHSTLQKRRMEEFEALYID